MMDSDLFYHYQLGIGFGMIILSTLLVFPGRDPNTDGIREKEDVTAKCAEQAKSDATPLGSEVRRRDNPADHFPEESWTPHQKMNFVAYLIIISVAIIIVNKEYGGVLKTFFQIYFPKEAALLFGTPPFSPVGKANT